MVETIVADRNRPQKHVERARVTLVSPECSSPWGASVQRTGRFPDLAVQLVRIGEETGRLEEMLQEVAEIYDQEVQRTLDRLLTLLAPVITVAMGAAIAGIIAAVMLAMLSINDLAG